MKQALKKYRRRRRRLQEENEPRPVVEAAAGARSSAERLSPYYNAGPVHDLPQQAAAGGEIAAREEAEESPAPAQLPTDNQEQASEPTLPVLNHSGQGEPEQVTAFNRGPLRLQGRTDADFDGGSFETTGVRVRPGTGCGGCGDCIHVTGTLVAHYSVATHVTLPSVSDYPNLTSCQRRRVQHAINTVLAPHEQRHVRAFRRYNGTTRRHFDLTLCRTEFDGAIDSMFQAEAQARQQAAQAASDALDPFFFDVDLDCDEPPAR
jgi:hypothetical protein